MLVIKKEYNDYVNKTFRLPTEIVETLEEVAKDKNSSLNKVVIQCLEFAIENISDGSEDSHKQN